MLKRLWPTLFTVFIGAAIAGVVYGSRLGGIVAIVLAAILVNGMIATVEDNQPGGFNNPDGRLTQRAKFVAWTIRVLGGIVLLAVAYVALLANSGG